MGSIRKLLDRSSHFLQRRLAKPTWDFSRYVKDPRAQRGRRWELNALMSALLFGLLTNRRSLRGTQGLTEWEGAWVRALIGGRAPDSTLYDLLGGLTPEGLREQLHDQVHELWRAKALEPVGLPCTVAAVDGKTIWSGVSETGPDLECQTAHHEGRPSTSQLRVIRTVLISAAGTPAIDQAVVPKVTNEMGAFATVFADLEGAYGVMIEVYSAAPRLAFRLLFAGKRDR